MDAKTRLAVLDALAMALVATSEEVISRAAQTLPSDDAALRRHAKRITADSEALVLFAHAFERVVSRGQSR